MIKVYLFLSRHLYTLHTGIGESTGWLAELLNRVLGGANKHDLIQSIIQKLYSCLSLAIPIALPLSLISGVMDGLNAWVIDERMYLWAVGLCITGDHIIGSWYHLKVKKDWNSGKNAWGLVGKISLCVIAGSMFESIAIVLKDMPLVYDYLKIVTRLMVLLYPAGSAFMNMSEITNGKFPPIGWVNRIKAFNKDLELKNFRDESINKNENETY